MANKVWYYGGGRGSRMSEKNGALSRLQRLSAIRQTRLSRYFLQTKYPGMSIMLLYDTIRYAILTCALKPRHE